MLITGTFSRAVDEKLRFTVPKEFREALGQIHGGVFYLAPGTDGSLGLYDESSFSAMAERLADASPTGADVRAFGRLFYAQARRVELDKSGRLRIPTELAEWAGLGKEAVLVGVGSHLEVWEPTRWQSYVAGKRSHYDQIAEAAFERTGKSP